MSYELELFFRTKLYIDDWFIETSRKFNVLLSIVPIRFSGIAKSSDIGI